MAEADASTDEPTIISVSPHFVRITNGGKIGLWVDFSLRFLSENPGRPLILHTLPSSPPNEHLYAVANSSENRAEEKEKPTQDQVFKQTADPKATGSALSASARNIPRLISTVEIIKREYFNSLTPGPESTGLYQYNFLGTVEARPACPDTQSTQEEQRQESIIAALDGKNHLKLEKTPYMSITLCTKALPPIDRHTTCQPPSVKRLSRSAKARQRRKRLRTPEAKTNDA